MSQYLPSTCGREEGRPWKIGSRVHQFPGSASHKATWVEPLYSWFSLTWWGGHVGEQNNGKMSLKFCIIIASQIPKRLFTLLSHSPIEVLLTVLMLQSRKGVRINLTPTKNVICRDDDESIITWPTTILKYSASSYIIVDVNSGVFLPKPRVRQRWQLAVNVDNWQLTVDSWKVFLRYMPWFRFPHFWQNMPKLMLRLFTVMRRQSFF